MPLFRQLGGRDGRVSAELCLYLGALGFSLFSLSHSLSLALPLPLLLFPHAASQTALITVPFEAVFQNENEEKAEVTASSCLNFLQLLGKVHIFIALHRLCEDLMENY